ncbi:virB8 family protein [Xenorhabdus sp. SGI246]|uniref:virB8 family protein n=1 Tax=Xenorhabdus sp. SGI246 TaxID=3158263 RepID=UPI00349F5AFD
MFGNRKKEVIKEAYDIEKGKDNLSPEQGRNIGEASRAYAQAALWFEKHVAEEEKKKTKNAKRLSIFFGVITFMSIGAVLGLTPLKTVEPYLLRVDNNSGYTDIVKYGGDNDANERDDSFWTTTYVRQRESYNFSTQDSRYHIVDLMSYPGTFTEYKNFQLSKKGYMEQLGDKRQIRVDINNIIFSQRDKDKHNGTVQIRFTKTILDDAGVPVQEIPATKWLATLSFDYGKPPKVQKDDWLNPRGFAVRSYELSQEVGY